jgi:predicted ATPase
MPPKKTNLGVEHTSFVDRKAEVATLRGLIEAKRRLITLLGPAGCGKTRLARRFGAHSDLDVVWFCDLCTARNADTADEILERELAGIRGSALVIIDNFEQLVASDGTVLMDHWLERLPEAHFLVTSRHALGFEGEAQLDLPPLDTEAAIQLFIDRATLVAPRWSSKDDLVAVEELVERLDRLPLAIELAAARMSVLSVSEILRRLPQRFSILQTQRKNVPERQSTMRAAIAWSWDLLEPWERLALFQINVFAAPFTIEDAETVVDLSAIDGAPAMLDVLQALKEKSVLRRLSDRFFWYENVREYVRSMMENVGELERTQLRHARHYLAVAAAAERTEDLAQIADQLWAIARNVLQVEPELAARAALVLDSLLTLRGMVESRLELAELAIEASSRVGLELEAEARARRSSVLRLHGRSDEAMEEILSALPLARASGSLALESRCLLELGAGLKAAGKMDESRRALARALEVFRQTHDRLGEASALFELGERRDLLAALALHREAGDLRGEGIALVSLADCDVAEDRIEEAAEQYERAIELLDSVRDQWWTAIAIGHLAHVRFESKRLEEAGALYRQAVEMMLEAGDERMAARFGAFSSVLETGAIDTLDDFEGIDAAQRILRAHRAEPKADEAIDRVEVSIDGRSFRTASGSVNLARRKVLRRLLCRLAEQRRDRPGDPVAPDLLVEAGWPDENLAHKAAVARLYVSISTLRKLGLREILLMKDDGYLLDPERTELAAERPGLTLSIKDALKGFVTNARA